MMSGKIWVEGKLGVGSSFYFTAKFKTNSIETIDTEKKQKLFYNFNVLIVEDNKSTQQVMKRYLESFGFNTILAESAEKAFEIYYSDNDPKHIDLILMDVTLPDINGIELYERIKAIDTSLTKKVIFMTGDIISMDTQDFLAETKAKYISKPFRINKIRQEIYNTLKQEESI